VINAEETRIEVHTKANLKERDVGEAEQHCLKTAKKLPDVIYVESHGFLRYDEEKDKYVFDMTIMRK
jgi:hypothetical protein